MDQNRIKCEITALEDQLGQMTPNMAAIEEYKRKESLQQLRVKELDEVTEERDKARRDYESMRKKRLDLFMAGFSVITNKLKEMYQVSTLCLSFRLLLSPPLPLADDNPAPYPPLQMITLPLTLPCR